jgi:uncharacterized protein YbjT (DUF2867 family)
VAGEPPRILVIGASGQIGMRVCRALAAANADVRALANSDGGVDRILAAGVDGVVRADLANPASLTLPRWRAWNGS